MSTELRTRKVLDRIKPYSPGKPIWEVQRELGLERVVKLASNENPLGPSPKAVAAIQSALPDIHRYPDAQAVSLRETLAEALELSPGQLIVTNGGDELITLLSETFLEPGDEIVAPSPTFSEYEFGALLMDAKLVSVPLAPGYRYDADALLAAVTERTKLVWLCSPNNPTGTYLPRGELERLLHALPPQAVLVCDAAYSHFATAEDYSDGLEFVRAGLPLIVLQTFSKAYGLAGIRVGFGAAPEAVIRRILQVKEPFNVNALAQVAAAAAVTDSEHLAASREVNTAGRKQLYAALDRLGLSYTVSMSNFVLIELGEQGGSRYEALMAMGVITRYGGAWGLPHAIRVSVGTEEENAFFLACLARLLEDRREG
nr:MULTISPECIES: histidinol-phosphate transaminase [unclassified Paenibacillus]